MKKEEAKEEEKELVHLNQKSLEEEELDQGEERARVTEMKVAAKVGVVRAVKKSKKKQGRKELGEEEGLI